MSWTWILLIIFLIYLAFMAFMVYRYRKYLQTGWFMLKAYRQLKQTTKPKTKTITDKPKTSDSPLVHCAKCQKWTSQDEAVKLKTNYFCSHSCMEKSFGTVK